jgi:hypothetical protein
MTNDYVNPEKREKELRNRATRRVNWTKKQWKISKNGNYYRDEKTKKYRVKIKDTFGKKAFDTLEKAKIAAFNGMEYLKEHNKW